MQFWPLIRGGRKLLNSMTARGDSFGKAHGNASREQTNESTQNILQQDVPTIRFCSTEKLKTQKHPLIFSQDDYSMTADLCLALD